MGQIRPYLVRTLTNLHMGTGNASGAIDKTVQRDATTGFPTLFTSGSKGSLREALKNLKDVNLHDFINRFFGSDKRGEGAFLDKVILISFPVQGNLNLFYQALSPSIANLFLVTCEEFGVNLNKELKSAMDIISKMEVDSPVCLVENQTPYLFFKKAKNIEFVPAQLEALKKLVGDSPVILPDILMKKACLRLPVRARNNLEVRNLWFEEYIPWATRFVLFVESNNENPENDFVTLEERLFNNSTILNLGANQSVGEGRCLVSTLQDKAEGAQK